MAPDPKADLAWLAFRYAAGELDDAEAAAFEQRLDADQAAREAVADAVALVAAVHEVVPVPEVVPFEPARRHPVRAALAWMAVGAAACLALMAGPRALRSGGPKPVEPRPLPAIAAPTGRAVALTWSGLRESEGEPLPWLDEPLVFDPEPAPTVEDEPAVPSWMLEVATLAAPGEDELQEN